MSLPICGGSGSFCTARKPSFPPTHSAVPEHRLRELAAALRTAAGGSEISRTLIDQVAGELGGVPRSHLLAAAATQPDFHFSQEHEVKFVACVGCCQEYGALDRIEQLLQLRDQRLADGLAAFDISPRRCMDRCDQSPVLTAATVHGIAALTRATAECVAEAVEHAFEAR